MNSEMAKAAAYLLTIKLAITMKCSHVVFEGDASVIVEWMKNTKSIPNWNSFAVLEETKDKLEFFNCWTFVRVIRTENRRAHNLARWADKLFPPQSSTWDMGGLGNNIDISRCARCTSVGTQAYELKWGFPKTTLLAHSSACTLQSMIWTMQCIS
ncbi:hypothetical protein RJ640_016375 [Escallonia rubra]|uniref:RNase H type-1 domain-containing protein n=1 Tax=Escallonia rubra TaxID=112253 RepID=A0AA88UF55_9ASTE|nr:hypothetical protein RJ640_016375 [Escallonia rubra]